MAVLKCDDGKEIKISKETEQELRKAFEKKNKINVWAFMAQKYTEDGYGLALHTPYEDNTFPIEYECRRGFNKEEIQEIIKGLQELIK